MEHRQVATGLVMAAILVLSPGAARAGGYAVEGSQPGSLGLAGAGVAFPGGPFSLFGNPAGIVLAGAPALEVGLVRGAGGCDLSGETRSLSADGPDGLQLAAAATDTMGTKDWVFGIGYDTPWRAAVSWSEPLSPGGAAPSFDLTTHREIAVLAARFGAGMAVGAGIERLDSDLTLRLPTADAGPPGLSFSGEGSTWRYVSGIQWQVGASALLGVSYRPRTAITHGGHLRPTGSPEEEPSPAGVRVSYPSSWSAGAVVVLSKGLRLLIDAESTAWSSVDRLVIRDDATDSEAASLERRWKNTVAWRAALVYQVTPVHSLRAGYLRETSPVPDDTLDALQPEGGLRQGYGIGYVYREGSVGVTAGYLLEQRSGREVAADSPLGSATGGDSLKEDRQTFGVSLAWYF